MIKSDVIHPNLLSTLAKCGHKTQLLIADGDYAFVTNSPRHATVVYLNLLPRTMAAPLILEKILTCINVEQATLMAYPDDFNNTIEAEYRAILGKDFPIEHLARADFYTQVKSDQTLWVIASGNNAALPTCC